MGTRRGFLKGALGAAAGFGLAQAVGGGRSAEAAALRRPRRAGGTLRVAGPYVVRGLDPAVGYQGSGILPLGIGETLLKIAPAGEIVPWLAERVDSVDSRRLRVSLRAGAAFHNGRPVDADAVRASILRSVEKNPSTANLLQLESVRAVDSLTVEIASKTVNGAQAANLASYFLAIHDAEAAARAGDDAFNAEPVMTGPFKVESFRPNESATVRRFDAHWGGPPALDAVEHRAVADGNARLLAALAGDADMARQLPPQGVAQARAMGLTVASVGSAYMYHLYLNNRRAPFDELPVRRAISLAVDRQTLVDRVLGGSGEAATGVYPRWLPFAPAEPFPYDPAEARRLLDGAGWQPGSDGIRARGGARLEFTALTYPQRPELGLLGVAIQAALREIGVAMSLESTEDIQPPVDEGRHHAAMYAMQAAPSAEPAFILNLIYRSDGPRNAHLGYSSPQLDAVIDRLNDASDGAERTRLALEAQRLLREDEPTLYLLSPAYHTALSARVANFEANPVESYAVDGRLALR